MSRAPLPMTPRRRDRSGFTLIEVMVATALLGFSLIVMFGFHAQAVRSNMEARKLTDCTYLAQSQLERLVALPWNDSYRDGDLEDNDDDATNDADQWAWLEHPSGSGVQPSAVNALNSTNADLGVPIYYITWDVQDMDDNENWARLRVRCTYHDEAFNMWKGTTISTYRFRD